MARKSKSVDDVVLECFEGSFESRGFSEFTESEYVGYVAGVVKLQNLNMDASTLEILVATRALFKKGLL